MVNEAQIEHWAGVGGDLWVAEAEQHDRMLEPYGTHVIAKVDPRPGERILDIGCGNGALALAMGTLVEPAGSVVGADISVPMLALARARAQEQGLTDVTFIEVDAQVHAFEPASFDAVTSRFGVMFFEDAPAAFANVARAVRPGGRVGFVCWREAALNEWVTVPATILAEHLGRPPFTAPDGPGPFSLADADHVRELLAGAGLVDIEVAEIVERNWLGATIADARQMIEGGGVARALTDGASPEELAAAWAAIEATLDAHVHPDGVSLPGRAWLVSARRP